MSGPVDYFSLFADDEPAQRAQAAALARELRTKEGLARLNMLSGDRVLAPMGQMYQQDANRDQANIISAGSMAGMTKRLREAARAQAIAQIEKDKLDDAQAIAKEGRDQSWESQKLGRSEAHAMALERMRQAGMDRRVRRGGGGGPNADLQRRKLQAEVEALERGEGTPAQQAAAANRTEAQVQGLGKDLADTPQMANDLAVLQEAAGREDTPGFGPIEGRLPNILTSNEGVRARQAALRAVAAYKLKMTGTAASEREAENIMESLGMGRTATPEAFRAGLTALAQNGEDAVAQVLAKYPQKAIQEFQARGGKTGLGLRTPPAPAGGGLAPDKKARLEELRRKREEGSLK